MREWCLEHPIMTLIIVLSAIDAFRAACGVLVAAMEKR